MLEIATLNTSNYIKALSWRKFYDEKKSIRDVYYDHSWIVLFENLFTHPKFENTQRKLKDVIIKKNITKIYPLPEYIFSAFLITPANNVKVVIIGQDPYFNGEMHNLNNVPQAMGLSFSVPKGIKIPSSLMNIYKNLEKYGHIKEIPETGNLWFWAIQGCLMLNTALTVEDGSKESHTDIWEWFTDYIIEYISKYMKDVIFVLWGSYAYTKKKLINENKHFTIISSHPSGLSANKEFKNYPAFMNCDHFGKINDILTHNNKKPIIW